MYYGYMDDNQIIRILAVENTKYALISHILTHELLQ